MNIIIAKQRAIALVTHAKSDSRQSRNEVRSVIDRELLRFEELDKQMKLTEIE